MQLRTRIAPTPSGYLHIGNAFSFLLTWLHARSQDGTIFLRIDDLDATRTRAEYVDDIFRSLEWLGLDFDEGPQGPDEFANRFSQKHRLGDYRKSLQALRSSSEIFACLCSRRSIQQRTEDGLHPAACRQREISFDVEKVAWRIPTSGAAVTWDDVGSVRRHVDIHQTMRDFVIRKKDGMPAYQIASIVDDHTFKINYVVRGEDLIPSSGAQKWLASKLGLSFASDVSLLHHPLLHDDLGRKLSKSSDATSLRAMRTLHKSPAIIYQQLAQWLGIQERVSNSEEALAFWKDRRSVS